MGEWDMIPKIKPQELKEILEIVKNMDNPPAIMVFGPPGVGKTQILKRFANENNYDLRVRHLSRMDPSDWTGVPKLDGDYTVFLPPYFFRGPEKDEEGNDKRIVVFFDELNTAFPQVLNAALDVLLEKSLDDKKLPENTIMVAAGNLGIEDGTYVEELSVAVKTRLLQFVLRQDPDDWVEWAQNAGISQIVIQFIEKNPHFLIDLQGMSNREKQVATPRGWERVSDIIKSSFITRWYNNEIIKSMIYGAVGKKAGDMFIRFAVKLYENVENADYEYVRNLVKKTYKEIGMQRFMDEQDKILSIVNELLSFDDEKPAIDLAENILQYIDRGILKAMFEGRGLTNLRSFLEKNYPDIYEEIK